MLPNTPLHGADVTSSSSHAMASGDGDALAFMLPAPLLASIASRVGPA